MFHILIVEDDSIQRNALEKLIQRTYPDSVITTTDNYESATALVEANDYHLFILDIRLTEDTACATETPSGLDLASYIRSMSKYKQSPIIFITALLNEALTAINDFHCYHYIVKPYSDNDVINAIHSVFHEPLFQDPFELYDLNGIYFKLYTADIIYIQLDAHNHLIHTTKGTYHVSAYMVKKSGADIFSNLVRCYRSFYINPRYILSYDKTNKLLNLYHCDVEIPVGRVYKNTIISIMEDMND